MRRRERGFGEEDCRWGGGECKCVGVLAGRGLVEGEGGGYCGGDVKEEGEGVGREY